MAPRTAPPIAAGVVFCTVALMLTGALTVIDVRLLLVTGEDEGDAAVGKAESWVSAGRPEKDESGGPRRDVARPVGTHWRGMPPRPLAQ